ncbi:MAG TPA: hypothetical protein VGM41_01190 [Chitinophagaceae bacterium]|jgi:hypothetical protein
MKRQTSPARFLLTLGAIVITWTACQQPVKSDDIDYEKAKHHIIPMKEAIEYQQRFLQTYDTTLRKMVGSPFLEKSFRIPNAETFDKNAIKLLLHQGGVDSIRIYYGMDSTGGMRQVLVGVDHNGKNIYTNLVTNTGVAVSVPGISSANAQDGGDSSAIENGQTCPPCTLKQP